jgi:hypothetical protein
MTLILLAYFQSTIENQFRAASTGVFIFIAPHNIPAYPDEIQPQIDEFTGSR